MQFPEKALFGKMSPSLVKGRADQIEEYLKEICKNEALLRIPFVRKFLKLPMNSEELKALEAEYEASSESICCMWCAHRDLEKRVFMCLDVDACC